MLPAVPTKLTFCFSEGYFDITFFCGTIRLLLSSETDTSNTKQEKVNNFFFNNFVYCFISTSVKYRKTVLDKLYFF